MSYPADIKYTKEHEWVRVESDTDSSFRHDGSNNSDRGCDDLYGFAAVKNHYS